MKKRCLETNPQTEILHSDNRRLHARLSFGPPQLQELKDGSEAWTKVSVPGLEEDMGPAGEPAVPVLRRLIAVPRGAVPFVSFARPRPGEQLFLNLYPFQPLRDEISTDVDRYEDQMPPPKLFAHPPFVKDEKAYCGSTRFPERVCRVTPLGTARDLHVALLECACGQYNPATRVLQLFDSVEVEVGFKGGAGAFLTDAAMNPFEGGYSVYGGVLNHAAVKVHLERDPKRRKSTGEELLILTHPKYRDAAMKLAHWRQAGGIPTSVFNVNDGATLNTKEKIRAFIQKRYHECKLRPSYVLLFGDVADVPTWVIQRLIKPEGTMLATDFPYATLADDPEAMVLFPDLAVGRIPVNSAEEAKAVVDKIIEYESNPPGFSTSYHTVTVAAYFQCCRTDVELEGVEDGRSFIHRAEFLRDSLMDVGYDVQRIYNTNTKYSDDDDPPYEGDPTPRFFGNSTPLPDELGPDSGFPWSGGTQDIVNAFNAGRAFVFHLDHGYTGGWGDPDFDKSNVADLSNQFPPVVFNMNCSSGNFELTCFSEVALKPTTAGAIGVFGWTRMSNTGFYYSLLKGTLGALWPDTFPEYGDGTARLRLGDVLNYSRSFMAEQKAGGDPDSDAYKNAVNHVRLYHLIGDPTLRPWTKHPYKLPTDILVDRRPDFLHLGYPVESAVVTVQQETADGSLQPVGRAVVRNGEAVMNYFLPLGKGPLLISAIKDNAVPTQLNPVQSRRAKR